MKYLIIIPILFCFTSCKESRNNSNVKNVKSDNWKKDL